MKNNHYTYTQTELENLSAYLDHELTPGEEAQLRTRLAQDKHMREALENLRLTRYTLRNTPKVRRQRSFVLSPEMVRQQKSAWRLFNYSRTIAVAASVLFALVVGGQMLAGGGVGMLAAAPQADVAMNSAAADEAAEEPMMMEAPAEESYADDMAASGLAEDTEADQAMDAEMAEPAAEMMPMPTGTLEPASTKADEGDLPTEMPGGGGGLPPTETQQVDVPEAGTAESEAASSGLASDDGDMGDTTLRTGEQSTDEIAGMENTELVTPPPTEQGIQPVQWVQGGLLLVALLGAALAIYFRRSVL